MQSAPLVEAFSVLAEITTASGLSNGEMWVTQWKEQVSGSFQSPVAKVPGDARCEKLYESCGDVHLVHQSG